MELKGRRRGLQGHFAGILEVYAPVEGDRLRERRGPAHWKPGPGPSPHHHSSAHPARSLPFAFEEIKAIRSRGLDAFEESPLPCFLGGVLKPTVGPLSSERKAQAQTPATPCEVESASGDRSKGLPSPRTLGGKEILRGSARQARRSRLSTWAVRDLGDAALGGDHDEEPAFQAKEALC